MTEVLPSPTKERPTSAGDPAGKAISATDFSVMAGIPFLSVLAWFLPERYWHAISRWMSPLAISDLTKDPAATAAIIRKTLGERLKETPAIDILHGMAGEGIITFLQVLKSYRWDGWSPRVEIRRADLVAQAQANGRGVILWVAHAFHGHLGAKVAFHRAGLRVHHLSTPAHGFSATRFGVRYLNPIQARIEDRYIAERILLPLEGQNAALNTIVRRLKASAIVSITGQRGASRTVSAPFMEGQVSLAPGAPTLAHMTGAAVIPVFAFRKDTGIIEVTFEEPIEISTSLPRQAAVSAAVREYALRLQPYVLRFPSQWLGWVQL